MEINDSAFKALQKYTKALSVTLTHRDRYTRLHSDRVVSLSKEIGWHCKLTRYEINGLIVGATFHDVGKIGVPDSILLKPSALDASELEVIKRHSVIGEDIMLATALEGADYIAKLIRQHHEFYNGLGYPDQLAGEDISICARIVAIADGYDAIAMHRTYHPSRTHMEVMDVMNEEAGTKYDPEIMRVFNQLITTSQNRVT